ncbi:hypothetical protein [Selenomonas sp. F0473]|uniref:hypothetical protein n=1 Tax=Selenomonas sp. F0473 TaxID=999423 RepID=UPI00029E7585|nr:hypothetical protein [Selenomonas sp. F0473]EKU71114.1 hypothetical protein HMPREF9161_01208 [Selenomonas sp. F0473]
MNFKKLFAAAIIASFAFGAAPTIAPDLTAGIFISEAEAARGGARMSPRRAAPAAPKSAPAQSGGGKSVSGNGAGYAPSKSADRLDKNAPNAASAKPGAAAGAANPGRGATGWGNALRSIGFLAGGMLLGSMLASMFGLGSGFLADLLGVFANIALLFVALTVVRWIWNRFRGRKEEENVYRSAARPQQAAPRAPIADIRPPGASAPMPTRADADDSPRAVADRYRNR